MKMPITAYWYYYQKYLDEMEHLLREMGDLPTIADDFGPGSKWERDTSPPQWWVDMQKSEG